MFSLSGGRSAGTHDRSSLLEKGQASPERSCRTPLPAGRPALTSLGGLWLLPPFLCVFPPRRLRRPDPPFPAGSSKVWRIKPTKPLTVSGGERQEGNQKSRQRVDYLDREVSRYAFVCNYLKHRKRVVRKKHTHTRPRRRTRAKRQTDSENRKKRGGKNTATSGLGWGVFFFLEALAGQEEEERKVISKPRSPFFAPFAPLKFFCGFFFLSPPFPQLEELEEGGEDEALATPGLRRSWPARHGLGNQTPARGAEEVFLARNQRTALRLRATDSLSGFNEARQRKGRDGGDYGRLRNQPDGHRPNSKASWEDGGAVFNLFWGEVCKTGRGLSSFLRVGARGRRSRWENSSHLGPSAEGRQPRGVQTHPSPGGVDLPFPGLKPQIPAEKPDGSQKPRSPAPHPRPYAARRGFSYSLSQA